MATHPRRASPGAALAEALHIRPGEGRKSALLFLHLLLASAIFVLGRTVRDTLFLSRLAQPMAVLPWMFVLYGLVSSLTALIYARLAGRWSASRLISGAVLGGASTYLVVWVLIRAGVGWIYPVFYVWSEVVANLFIVQFWTLANDLNDPRAARRLFGTIGSARVLGSVLVGLGTGAVVRSIGTPQLLLVLAALMAGVAVSAALQRHEARAEDGPGRGRGVSRRGAAGNSRAAVFASPYARALATMTLLIFVALTVGDFQFKAIARASLQGDDLARFFGWFYAGTGILSGLFQIFITPRLLARFGVGVGMAAMPALFGPASLLLLLHPGLAIATAMKFADNGLQYTIHDTTYQALYVPFAAELRARTRAVLDAMVKPLAYGAGGLVLLLFASRLPVERLSLLTVPVVALWLALIPVVRARYLASLEATLSARGSLALDHDFVVDAAGRRALLAVLARGEPRAVLAAIEALASERSEAYAEALRGLIGHARPEIRAAALGALADLAPEQVSAELQGEVRAAIADDHPGVRAAACRALARLVHDEAVEALAPLTEDPAPDARRSAIHGLIEHGGVEGSIVGGAALGRLLASEDADDRREAARVLGLLGPPAYRPLRRLLEDPEPAVRRAALNAAPGVADPRLTALLVELLDDHTCRKSAGKALVAIGAPALAALLARLAAPATSKRSVRLALPRIIGAIPVASAYQGLLARCDESDAHVRLRIFAALGRLRQALRHEPEPIVLLERLLGREFADAGRELQGWRAVAERDLTPLAVATLRFERARAEKRVLRILELRFDAAELQLVHAGLAEPGRRNNAMETLDAILAPSLRPLVMPLFDDAARPAGGIDAVAFLRERVHDPNPWLALVALDALARLGELGPGERAFAAASREPLVREGAESRKEAGMYTTVEKVLFLKSVPVFEKVAAEDLAPLARVATAETFAAGQQVFREGERGDALFVLVRGRVAVERGGKRLSSLGPGEAFGEMAVLDEAPRVATVVALEESELLRIGSEEFYEILHDQVEIAEGVIRLLVRRLRAADSEDAVRGLAAR